MLGFEGDGKLIREAQAEEMAHAEALRQRKQGTSEGAEKGPGGKLPQDKAGERLRAMGPHGTFWTFSQDPWEAIWEEEEERQGNGIAQQTLLKLEQTLPAELLNGLSHTLASSPQHLGLGLPHLASTLTCREWSGFENCEPQVVLWLDVVSVPS